ncbi:MAG: portal protein [Minwuia sp.]|uniref:portal protein n=1 Tax=Minwuia sp. TaxID=2493630 RepID=UPI003A869721
MTEADTDRRADTLRRFHAAERRRRAWDAILDDAYAFALPHHDTVRAGAPGGARRDREIFDNTAVQAVQWRKSRLHGQLFPPFRPWMDFDAVETLAMDPETAADFEAHAAEVSHRFHAAIEASNFHIEIDPALGDALVSTGALMVHEGSFAQPVRFEAIPARELIPEESAGGMLSSMFRQRRLPARQIADVWPDALLTPDLARLAAEAPDTDIELIEAVMADQPGGPANYEVWCCDQPGAEGSNRLLQRDYAASPLIAFRMDKAPGEWMGRGPVLNVLADIKTANKVVELILKNASIAVTGIWQAEDDGVLNPANIRLTPGTIIPKAVGSAGLTPLEAPGKFDVSQIVLARLQDTIRSAIMGPELPPADQGVRTALEIGIRQQESAGRGTAHVAQAADRAGLSAGAAGAGDPLQPGHGRLAVPHRALPGRRRAGAGRRPTSPLVRMQEAAAAAEQQVAYASAAQTFPDILGQVVDRPGYLRHFLKQSGFPADYLAVQPPHDMETSSADPMMAADGAHAAEGD